MITIEDIKNEICNVWGVSQDVFESHSRKIEDVRPRQIFAYMVRHYTKKTLSEIGREIGNKHASIMHSINQVQNLIDTDADFKAKIESIQKRLDYLDKFGITVKKAVINDLRSLAKKFNPHSKLTIEQIILNIEQYL